MGTYKVSQKEIEEELVEMLDELEGEVFRSIFMDACKNVGMKYKYFSDEK